MLIAFVLPLLSWTLTTASPVDDSLKRAHDRFEFGDYQGCTADAEKLIQTHQLLTDVQAVDAYRLLGICDYQLGNRAGAEHAFHELLIKDPDQALDPFFVPPPIVELFDTVKKREEPTLAPRRIELREARRKAQLMEDARRRELLALRQPAKTVVIRENLAFINWLPFGAGQFQNHQPTKGTLIASGELLFALINIGAVIFHNQFYDRTQQGQNWHCNIVRSGCSEPPLTDTARQIFTITDVVKYTSAGLFWATYGYGVWDAHRNFVPRVETQITPTDRGALINLKTQF